MRVQLRHAQQTDTQSSILKDADLTLDVAKRRVLLNRDEVELTATEFDILRTLMQSAGYVFTRDELIEKVLGYSYAGLGRTIDSHSKNLRQKIESDHKAPQYILTVYGVGYRFAEHES